MAFTWKGKFLYIVMFFSTIIWGGGFVASKYVAMNLPVFISLTYRFLMGISILLPLALILERENTWPKKSDFPVLIFLGLTGLTANNGFVLAGLQRAPASVGSLIIGINPIMIALLAHLFLKESLTFRQKSGMPISFIGVALIVWQGGNLVASGGWWNLLFIGSVLSWATYSVMGRRVLMRMSPLIATLWATIFGLVWALPIAIWEGLLTLHYTQIPVEAWYGLAYMGFLSSGLCFVLWYCSINQIGASKTGIFLNIVPVSANIFSFIILGEVPTPSHIIGALLVISGVTITNWPEPAIPEDLIVEPS